MATVDELISDDHVDPAKPNWAGDEAPETEIEWKVFQKRPASNPGGDELEAADNLPHGDEMVTRRYEFYVYNGPVNADAMATEKLSEGIRIFNADAQQLLKYIAERV